MRSFYVQAVDGCRLHAVCDGEGSPLILCHGFPDYWEGWRAQIAALSKQYRVIAADGRGYNLSGKPTDIAAYTLEVLVEDVDVLVRSCGSQRPILVGHDWGGAVAWAYACKHPDKLAGLAVLSAPHPMILQQALKNDPLQQQASSYIPRLRAPQAEAAFQADQWALMRAMLSRLRALGLSDDHDEARYMAAWAQPGALTGALNWYRANPLDDETTIASPEALSIPVLLMWGDEDPSLLPSLAWRHASFARDLEIDIVPGAGHWLQRERPDYVNARLSAFAQWVLQDRSCADSA